MFIAHAVTESAPLGEGISELKTKGFGLAHLFAGVLICVCLWPLYSWWHRTYRRDSLSPMRLSVTLDSKFRGATALRLSEVTPTRAAEVSFDRNGNQLTRIPDLYFSIVNVKDNLGVTYPSGDPSGRASEVGFWETGFAEKGIVWYYFGKASEVPLFSKHLPESAGVGWNP